ncbi:MAG: asparagine synthase (glutamine-hydrolyzing) [Acidobacteria bacterium]|nr:asparagine synthase (glutamine-hydrolyzing) [Acidobacteriota bacterium]
MCGIAGLVGENNVSAAEYAVGGMIGALARRGPDGEGMEVWPGAVLGHRRLAIFDLSDAGRQPMLSPDGQVGIVFNGAVYNFLELRRNLLGCGYEFRSHTDTEVLIHGYLEWGLDRLVDKLKGMFAFGLWDNRARKLFLVRDRLGVKPLFYSHRNGQLAFASTARALRAGGFAGEIDEQALTEYLEFGFVTDDRSIYQGISKVQAATIVEWTAGKIDTREYWLPPQVVTAGAPSFEESVEETERLFLSAVEKRLHADVPVGTLLSGGVDSSLVCWAVSKLGGDIKTFTVGTPGDPMDETADARATARSLKINHCVIELSGKDDADVSGLVSAFGEPFACASALGMLSVSRAVRAAATVLLTGDGGDDVFLGYPEHRNFWRATRLARALPDSAAGLWARARDLFPDSGALRRVRSFFDYTTGGVGAAATVRDGLPTYRKHGLLAERLIEASVMQREMPWSIGSARQLLADFLAYDRRTRFTGEYLTKVDGATMYHSLEARSPFLDQDLWEFASTLPFDLRLRGGQLKAILRELASRHLGERVARGRKRGFGIPVQRWIAGRWREAVRETFRNSILGSDGWIRSDAALALLDRAAEKGWAPHQLWYIFVLESWLRHERDESVTVDASGGERVRTTSPVVRAALM